MIHNINNQRKDKLEDIIFLEYLRDMKTSKVFYEYSKEDKIFILDYMIKNGIDCEIEWCYDATNLENLSYQLYLEDNNYKNVYTQLGMIYLRYENKLNFEKYFISAIEKIRKQKLISLDKYHD